MLSFIAERRVFGLSSQHHFYKTITAKNCLADNFLFLILAVAIFIAEVNINFVKVVLGDHPAPNIRIILLIFNFARGA
jgi:hypothetical protein